jgi:type II secretory pathway pseudopilin PulG
MDEPVLDGNMAPANEETADPEESGAEVIPGSVADGDASAAAETPDPDAGAHGDETAEPDAGGYDETSGITYEVPPRGLEIFGLKGEALPTAEDPAAEDLTADEQPAAEAAASTEVIPAAGEEAGPAAGEKAEQTTVEGIPPLSVSLSEAGKARPAPLAPHSVFNTAITTPGGPRPRREEMGSRDNPFWRKFGRTGDGGAPEDGGAPLTRFRDLPLDEKMRLWRIRAIIVVVVGVLFSLIVSWQVGLTLAIVAGIADTVYRSRTVESHAYTQAGTVDRATLRAQRATIKQLSAMERAGYHSLHRRPIPDSEEVIDHLVVGPTGVYAIDSEKWQKDLPIRQSNGKKLWLGPESKTERLEHAHWEAGQASQRLSAKLGMEVIVQPALAIYGPKISWVVLAVQGVDVFAGNELKQYLRRRARRKGLRRYTNEEIKKIYEAAGGVLPLEWHNTAAPVG